MQLQLHITSLDTVYVNTALIGRELADVFLFYTVITFYIWTLNQTTPVSDCGSGEHQ